MHVSSCRPHGSLSRPVRLLLRHGLLDSTTSFFDYGCGSGSDLEILARRGIAGEGWDPAMRPHASKVAADVVNLGYVLNVLPSSARPFVLAEAWSLAKGLMVVAVPPVSVLGDVFDVEQTLLDECRGTNPVKVGLGIYYVFRSAAQRQEFLSRNVHACAESRAPTASSAAKNGWQNASETRRTMLHKAAAGIAAFASLGGVSPARSAPGELVRLAADAPAKRTRVKVSSCKEVASVVKDTIAEHLSAKRSDVTPTSTLKELGADSLDGVELVMAYEETFGIEITDDLAETMTSVGKSIDVICQIKKLK